jgi:VCBS repeat-containing protein
MSRIAKILAMVLLLSPVTGLPARAAEVNLDPADPVVAVGDTISVSITVSLDETAGEQLAGGVIDLGYNDGVVEIIAVAIYPYLDFEPDPGSKTGPGLWEDIGFDAFVNDPVSENNLIASVTLEALAAGTSQLAVLGSSRFFSATAEFFPTLNGVSIRVNDPPTANNDSYATAEETTLAIAAPGVLANDKDVENDPLVAVIEAGPSNGSLTLNPDGSFTYTPNVNFVGSDSFTYHAFDGVDNSDVASVSISVGAVNDPPAANHDLYATAEETTLAVDAPGVLGNDTDVEGDSLTALLDAVPANGTLILIPDGSFTYTPNANFAGTDSFTYHASDGQLNSSVAVVTITVAAVNDPPVANNDAFGTNEDTTLSVTAPGVLANDLDAENNTLTAVLDSGPSNGSLTLYVDGSFDYTPNANFVGSDSFTYHAFDGVDDSTTATVSISVGAVNDPPAANSDAYATGEETTLAVAVPGVLGNDTDAEGNWLTALLDGGPAKGLLTLKPDGSFSYVPNVDFSGQVTFTYHANDGTADSNVTTVTIIVNAVNDPPFADAGPDQTVFVGDTIFLDGSWSYDVDGDALNCRWSFVFKPALSTAVLDTTDQLYPTFEVDVPGTYEVQLIVNDGKVDSAPDTVRIGTQNPALPAIYQLLLN